MKQIVMGLLLLASASTAMAQSPKGGEPYKMQRMQIEQLYSLLGRVQQLTDSVAQEREALGKQKTLWRTTCEKYLSKSEDQEKLQQLLKLTLLNVDGEDLFNRLQNALAKLAADVKDPAAADKKDKGKDNDKANKKNKSKAKDNGNGSSKNDGKPADDGSDAAPGTGEMSGNNGGTVNEYPYE